MQLLETRLTEAIALNKAIMEITAKDRSTMYGTRQALDTLLTQQRICLRSAIDHTRQNQDPNQLKLFPDEN